MNRINHRHVTQIAIAVIVAAAKVAVWAKEPTITFTPAEEPTIVTAVETNPTTDQAEPVCVTYAPTIPKPYKEIKPAVIPEETPAEETSEASESTPTYYEIPLTYDQQDAVRAICEEYSVPFDLILAMMDVESDFNPSAVSKTNDYGILQINRINHATLKKELGITDFMDMEQCTRAGCYMLGQLLGKYGDETKALMAYNMGPGGAAKKWAQGIYSSWYTQEVKEARENLCTKA